MPALWASPWIARVGTALLVSAIAVVTLPIPYIQPSPGLDFSFIAALHAAADRGLDVGADIVSTYGPLGFLSFPQWIFGPTSILALIYTIALWFTLVALLLHRSRQALPLWAAIVVTYVGAQAAKWLGVPEMAVALVTIICFILLERAVAGRALPTWAVVAAALGVAVLALGKLNTAPFLVASLGITVMAIGGRRQAAVFSSAFVVLVIALWFLAGQGLGNLLPFIETSAAMILGFNDAMGVDGDLSVHWMIAAAGLAVGAVAYVFQEQLAAWPRRYWLAAIAVGILLAFITLKASFVRWHFTFIFATLCVVAICLLSPRRSRRPAMLAIAATLIALLGATRMDAWAFLDPAPRTAIGQVATVLSNSAAAAVTRDSLAAAYALDAQILDRIRGERTHFGPLESGLAIAHPDVTWAPLPLYQDYTLYTPTLDRVNHNRLLSADGPRYIVRGLPVAIDERNAWWEGPSTMREMVCRYHEVFAGAQWLLLERGDDLCGEPRLIDVVEARPGETVEIPALGDSEAMIFARIHGLEPSPLERVQAFLFKAHEWYATLDEEPRSRLVAATAGQGLLLAVAASADYSPPFAFGPPRRTIAVAPGLRSPVETTRIRIEFWSVPLATTTDA